MEEDERFIDLKIIRARDLPSTWAWKSSLLSFVLVTPEGKHLYRTETVSGPHPEWNELFVIRSTTLSSSVRLQVFHVPDSSEMTLIGQTDVLVDALLRDDVNEIRCRLKKPGPKIRRNRGELFIRGKVHTDIEALLPGHLDPPVSTRSISSSDTSREIEVVSSPQPEFCTRELGHFPGALTNFLVQPDLASFPPVEPKHQKLSAALNQAESSISTLSTPSILQRASPATDGVESAASSGLLHDIGDILSNVIENVVHLGDTFAEVHPYAKLVWTVLSSGYKTLKAQVDRDERVRILWSTVQDVVAFFDEVKEEPTRSDYLKQVMVDAMKQIYECCQFLMKYADHGFAGRTFRNALNPKNDDAVGLMIDSFQTLKEHLDRGVSIDNWKYVRALGYDIGEMKDQIQELWLYTLIEGQVNVVECDTRRGCLPGTRTKLINDITEWIHDPSRGRMLWLSGPVGTGKSSVANTISGLFKGVGRLGASFRFDKQVDPSAMFRQIAYQLARIDKAVKDAVLSVLVQKGDISSAALPEQALKIIVQPLRTVDLVGPVVIVIDALDEIKHRDVCIRDDILTFFSDEEFALPDYVKVFITSRDDPNLRSHLQSSSGCEALSIDDYDDTPDDILLFIRHRLSEIQARARLADSWPPDGADRGLAERAGRQFQWAYVTCQFIAESPRSRLALILSAKAVTHGGSRHLDLLYDSVIQSAYEARNRDPTYILEFCYVVGCIATGKKAFRLEDLNDLLALRDDNYNKVYLPGQNSFSMEGAEQLVSSVRSLFFVTTTQRGSRGLLRLVHTSLFEFLTDETRCPHFHIDLAYWNLVLAIRSVRILNERLDVEIPETSQSSQDGMRKGQPVSNALRYACQFFVQHISEALDHQNDMLQSEMTTFLSNRLSRWIETMNALGLEWMESLEVLISSYNLPLDFKLLVTTTAEEKLAIIASAMCESVKQLAGIESTGDADAVLYEMEGIESIGDLGEPGTPEDEVEKMVAEEDQPSGRTDYPEFESLPSWHSSNYEPSEQSETAEYDIAVLSDWAPPIRMGHWSFHDDYNTGWADEMPEVVNEVVEDDAEAEAQIASEAEAQSSSGSETVHRSSARRHHARPRFVSFERSFSGESPPGSSPSPSTSDHGTVQSTDMPAAPTPMEETHGVAAEVILRTFHTPLLVSTGRGRPSGADSSDLAFYDSPVSPSAIAADLLDEPEPQAATQGTGLNKPRPWFRTSVINSIPSSEHHIYVNIANKIESAVTSSMLNIRLADGSGFGDALFSDAGAVLLEIWDLLERLSYPHLQFLALLEHCTDVFQAMCDLYVQGSTVTSTVKVAADGLLECFCQIRELFAKEVNTRHITRLVHAYQIPEQMTLSIEMLSRISQSLQLSTQLQNQASLLSTRQTMLDSQGTEEPNAYTQERIRALAQKVLANREDHDEQSELSLDEFHSTPSSLFRSITQTPAAFLQSTVRIIPKHDLPMDEPITRSKDVAVYKHSGRDEDVAVTMFADSMSSERFGNMVERWWKLSDPNVLELLGASDPANLTSIYTVTPYCAKGSLVQCLRNTPELEDPDLLQMMLDVVSGLEYLHERGIAHGNLQGENVLVGSDFNCFIAGFSHSSLVYPTNRQPRIPHILREKMSGWYAPEVWDGIDPYTRNADMYAFAIVCVEILRRGTSPWPPCSAEAMRAAVCTERKRPQLISTTLLDGGLRDVVEACWADGPETRPSSGGARDSLRHIWDKLGYDDVPPQAGGIPFL